MLNEEQQKLVVDNLGLVGFVLSHYFGNGRRVLATEDDAVQIGRLALCKAAERYNRSIGAFSTYAVRTIIGEYKRYNRDQMLDIRRVNTEAASLDRLCEIVEEGGRGPLPGCIVSNAESFEDRLLVDDAVRRVGSSFGVQAPFLHAALVGQMSKKDACASMGISTHTFKDRLWRYKMHLGNALT